MNVFAPHYLQYAERTKNPKMLNHNKCQGKGEILKNIYICLTLIQFVIS